MAGKPARFRELCGRGIRTRAQTSPGGWHRFSSFCSPPDISRRAGRATTRLLSTAPTTTSWFAPRPPPHRSRPLFLPQGNEGNDTLTATGDNYLIVCAASALPTAPDLVSFRRAGRAPTPARRMESTTEVIMVTVRSDYREWQPRHDDERTSPSPLAVLCRGAARRRSHDSTLPPSDYPRVSRNVRIVPTH